MNMGTVIYTHLPFNHRLEMVRASFFHWYHFSLLGSHIVFSCHVFLVSSNLWQFLNLSSSLMTLTLLMSTCQLFCKISFSLDLSYIMSRLRLCIFGGNITKVMCLFSISYQGILDIFLLVVLNLIKVVSARFPHYKVAIDIFPLCN